MLRMHSNIGELGCDLGKVASVQHLLHCLVEQQIDPRYCEPCSVEFGTIMLWFYVADRSTLLFPVEKEYLRDRCSPAHAVDRVRRFVTLRPCVLRLQYAPSGCQNVTLIGTICTDGGQN